MSFHYLIDGYNLIWSTDRFFSKNTDREGALHEQRDRLLRYLETFRSGQLTVVFDGQEDVQGPPWRGRTQVLFSRGEEADDVIKRLVTSATNPALTVVVTDDREVERWARVSKAKALGCPAFLALVDKATTPSRSGQNSGKPPVPDHSSINDEFKKIWKLDQGD